MTDLGLHPSVGEVAPDPRILAVGAVLSRDVLGGASPKGGFLARASNFTQVDGTHAYSWKSSLRRLQLDHCPEDSLPPQGMEPYECEHPLPSPCPIRAPLRASRAVPKPSSRHTTLAACRSHFRSQTVPHVPAFRTSTRPSPAWAPPFRRTRACRRKTCPKR